jgi:hypothetical protein
MKRFFINPVPKLAKSYQTKEDPTCVTSSAFNFITEKQSIPRTKLHQKKP